MLCHCWFGSDSCFHIRCCIIGSVLIVVLFSNMLCGIIGQVVIACFNMLCCMIGSVFERVPHCMLHDLLGSGSFPYMLLLYVLGV